MSLETENRLPSGWSTATINELVGRDGVFIDGDWVESKDQDPDGDVRLIQLADVGDGAFQDKSCRFLTSKKAAELRCTFLCEGDVLIARMPDPLGRACIFPGDQKQAVTVVDVCVVRTGGFGANHRWLVWAVNSPDFRNAVASLQSGSTRKRISRGNLSTLSLPVPPLNEQTRIADEVEKQLTRLDTAATALKRVQANLKRYRASVLKAACEGRLVTTEAELARRESRSYEPASVLLEGILAERRARWEADQIAESRATKKNPINHGRKEKYKEPAPPCMSDLSLLPEGWCWSSLEQVTVLFVDSAHRTPRYGSVGFPALGPRDVVNGILDLENARVVGDAEFAIQTARRVPQSGDIIYSRELSYGWAAILPNNTRACLSQGMCLFRPHDSVSANYVIRVLNGPLGRKQASKSASGSAHPHINLSDIKTYHIPLPPLPEQRRIVAELDRRLSIIQELDVQIESNLKHAEGLRQSILKDAFQGKLVPQDPNDEPATALLERIRGTVVPDYAPMRAKGKKPTHRAPVSKEIVNA